MRKGLHVAVCAIARKITVSVWYAMKGYLPHILEAEIEMKAKLNRISQELGEEFRKDRLDYKTLKEFTDEYLQLILFNKQKC